MTGIIICDSCGRLFIGNGSLKKIPNQTPLVLVLLASKLSRWKGIRQITSKLIGKIVVPQFDKDLCSGCCKID